jgi:hypothetical protein
MCQCQASFGTTSCRGMFKPTAFPMAPVHIVRYSSTVIFPSALASMTSAVWHGWMKKTGLLVAGCSYAGQSDVTHASKTSHSDGDAANDTNILGLRFEVRWDQILVQRSHCRRVSVLGITDADVQDGHAIDLR